MTDSKRSSPVVEGRQAGAAERARGAAGAAPAAAAALPRRWTPSSQGGTAGLCKLEVLLRLFRGESLDALPRETKKPASRIVEWRDYVVAGEELLKSHAGHPADEAWQPEKRDLQAVPVSRCVA